MRNRHTLFGAILVNLTFLATDVSACSMCITALADYYLPPIILWVPIAITWFVLNSVVSSVTGIILNCYPKKFALVLSIVIVILLFILAGAFAGMGVMLVLFVPAVAAFVQSFDPKLRIDFPGGTRAIYWIGVLHLVGVACAAVLMVHTHLTRTPEKFIVEWSGTSIASMKFSELKAQGPQALAALRYIKKNGGEYLAAKADESIKEIEDSENANRQHAPVADRNENDENAIPQADEKIKMPEKKSPATKSEVPLATVLKPVVATPSWTEPKKTNSFGMTFVYIKPGTFMMGSPDGGPANSRHELQYQVTLTKGFYMQTTEVTQGQWKAVMGNNPSYFKNCGDACPVEQVSYDDVQEFILRLDQEEGVSSYHLPTEAEWEYACRAGTNTKYSFGNSESQMSSYVWCNENSGGQTHPVAKKQPNAWGIYDMHGNVSEWCQDWYGPYPSGSVTDPASPGHGLERVDRGGGIYSPARGCRSAYRSKHHSNSGSFSTGFRLARTR